MDSDDLIQSGLEEGEQCDDNVYEEAPEGIVGVNTSSSRDALVHGILPRLPLTEVSPQLAHWLLW